MKRIEITYRSNLNELDKLNAKLERAEKNLEKKRAAAEKMGVAEWSVNEWRAWMDTVETENGWILNKEDVKKNSAFDGLWCAERDLEEVKEAIERAEKRFAKIEKKLDEYRAEVEKIEDLKMKEELWKLEFEQEQKEWKKDGITLEGRYYGTTPSGKRFTIVRNWGFTKRSLHCYTLTVDGKTVFTSGEFWRAYGDIKNN